MAIDRRPIWLERACLRFHQLDLFGVKTAETSHEDRSRRPPRGDWRGRGRRWWLHSRVGSTARGVPAAGSEVPGGVAAGAGAGDAAPKPAISCEAAGVSDEQPIATNSGKLPTGGPADFKNLEYMISFPSLP